MILEDWPEPGPCVVCGKFIDTDAEDADFIVSEDGLKHATCTTFRTVEEP